MRNPLRKRYKREIKKEWFKYLVLILILALVIGFVSAEFVGNESMITSLDNSYEDYNIEDGSIEFESALSDDLKESIQEHDVTLYEKFNKDCEQDNDNDGEKDATVRVFKIRNDVDLACVLEGRLPTLDTEIAIDRMHADNNSLSIGDSIYVEGNEYTITGLVSLPDYYCLYENNSDFMFDALTFNVAIVTEQGYDRLDTLEKYTYAYKYDKTPANDNVAKDMAEDFLDDIVEDIKATYFDSIVGNENMIQDFVPAYLSNSINFAYDDLKGDLSMSYIILIVFVVVIAFIFGVSIRNTITKEATTIGTLRASGYTRAEMVRHYIIIPTISIFIAAIIGNILGYTVLKDVVVGLYYNSYSLPTYKTIWSCDGLLFTTIGPILIMLIVNVLIVFGKMRINTLKFLRGDLSKSKRSHAIRLPKWKFFRRFRLRIIFQNIGGYVVLLFGMFFVVFLLIFATAMPETLKKYQKDSVNAMFANYQYVLKSSTDDYGNEITTSVADAEKYSCSTLETIDGVRVGEPITVYGIIDNSAYIDLGDIVSGNDIFVSSCYATKFGIKIGDTITLKKQYDDDTYTFNVVGIYEYLGSMSIFMNNNAYNEIFELKEGSFTGYLSNEEISDIDAKYIYTSIDKEDITKVSRQLNHSMGGMMDFFRALLIIVSTLLVIILTKIILERNTISISMIKVLGYKNGEIARLYILTTGIVALISVAISAVLGNILMSYVWRVYLYTMDGWLGYSLSVASLFKIGVLAYLGFIVAAVVNFEIIKKIPMTDALKNVE